MSVQIIGMERALKAVRNVDKQARFAMSRAINTTALAVQRNSKDVLDDAFDHVRGRWWKPKQRYGFNIRPFARKDRLYAVVGTAAPWVALHEKGGIKRAAGSLAIPQKELKTKPEKVRRVIRPQRIAQKLKNQKRLKVKGGSARPLKKRDGSLITKMPSGQRGLFVRIGDRVRALYLFEREARIRKRLNWVRDSRKVVDRMLDREFSKEFKRAMATAR